MSSILIFIGLQTHVLLIALICALAGTFILSRFTMSLGSLTYPVNFCALFAGAVAANLVMKRMGTPLDYSYDRPLIVSIAGMAVASLVTLVFLPRDRRGD